MLRNIYRNLNNGNLKNSLIIKNDKESIDGNVIEVVSIN